MDRFNHFSGRKIVSASTRTGLVVKMEESKKRGWHLVGSITQYNISGHWLCVMEFPSRRGVRNN